MELKSKLYKGIQCIQRMTDTTDTMTATTNLTTVTATTNHSTVTATNQTSIRRTKAIDIAADLYAGNPFMQDRIDQYLTHILTNNLAADFVKYKETVVRQKWLDRRARRISASFMDTRKYSYIKETKSFVRYDGIAYRMCNEDDVIHDVLRNISHDIDTSKRVFMEKPNTDIPVSTTAWKTKTQEEVLGQIRETDFTAGIPESTTIQNTINAFYPTVFSTRNAAKHFLTMLGDALLGKCTDLTYICASAMKPLVGRLGEEIARCVGRNVLGSVKYKYHDHEYKTCRIMTDTVAQLTPDGFDGAIVRVSASILDIIYVATHYSKRHKSADIFATMYLESDALNCLFYLKDHTQDDIVHTFTEEYIQPVAGSSINRKNMLFLWKEFLSTVSMPNIIFTNTLFVKFDDMYERNDSGDYLAITSAHLPDTAHFLKFWEEEIRVFAGDTAMTRLSPQFNELEIDEIICLYRRCSKGTNMSGERIAYILNHFHPELQIDGEKYVKNVAHKQWSKSNEVIESIDQMREMNALSNRTESIPMLTMYEYYADFSQTDFSIVSKQYFEMVCESHLRRYIDKTDDCISAVWWTGTND